MEQMLELNLAAGLALRRGCTANAQANLALTVQITW
jgi:hypothetical protein